MKTTIKFFTEKELKLFFTELEHRRLTARTPYAEACAYRNEALFKVMYYCALRASEASLLTADCYNVYSQQIYCRRLKGGNHNTLLITSHDILLSLKRHLQHNAPQHYLFENQRDNTMLSRKTMDTIFKSCCKAANIGSPDKWHCHTLRHTRAVHLADEGLDIKDLQFWLGHQDIKNTMIYFQFTTAQQEAMYRKLLAGKSRKYSLIKSWIS